MIRFQLGKLHVELEPSFLMTCVFLGVLLAMPGDQTANLAGAFGGSTSFWGVTLLALVMSLSVFMILAVHELGHALTLLFLGYKAVKISFKGMGQSACLTQVPIAPTHEWKMTLMGPVANVVVGLILMVVGQSLVGSQQPSPSEMSPVTAIFMEVGIYCLGFGALGFIPIPPMDAGHAILRALPKEKHPAVFTAGALASFALVAACLGAQSILGAVIFGFLGIYNWSLHKSAAMALNPSNRESLGPSAMDALMASRHLIQLTLDGWLALREGNVQEAVRLGTLCLKQTNSSLPPQVAVGAYDLLAWAAMAEANPQKALNHVAKGAALSGGMFRPLTKAMALDALGQKDEALEFAFKAADTEPTETSGKLAFKLLVATGNIQGAKAFAQNFAWPKEVDAQALIASLEMDQEK